MLKVFDGLLSTAESFVEAAEFKQRLDKCTESYNSVYASLKNTRIELGHDYFIETCQSNSAPILWVSVAGVVAGLALHNHGLLIASLGGAAIGAGGLFCKKQHKTNEETCQQLNTALVNCSNKKQDIQTTWEIFRAVILKDEIFTTSSIGPKDDKIIRIVCSTFYQLSLLKFYNDLQRYEWKQEIDKEAIANKIAYLYRANHHYIGYEDTRTKELREGLLKSLGFKINEAKSDSIHKSLSGMLLDEGSLKGFLKSHKLLDLAPLPN